MTLTRSKPRKPTLEHRKRSGLHHRHNHEYVKTYWPYLPVLAILSMGLIGNSWLGSVHRSVLGYATDMSVSSLLNDTNVQRQDNGEASLNLNTELGQAAQTKANDMSARDYWSHDTPDGKTPWTFIIQSGYNYQAAGENLAYGFTSANDTVAAWMNSPEHRANILNANYRDVGFGVANIRDYQHNGPETLVVAMYGEPVGLSQSATASGQTVSASGETQPVTQLQLVASSSPMNILVLVSLGSCAAMFLIIRHSLAWRRALLFGEAFVLRHPLLDVAAVTLVSASLVLSHTVGLIR